MNNEIKITDLDDRFDNLIEVQVTEEIDALIEAHNSSEYVHRRLFEPYQNMFGRVEQLENTMLHADNLPTRLSQFQNDMNFVSESSLVQSLDSREYTNLTTVETKLDELRGEIAPSFNSIAQDFLSKADKDLSNVEPETKGDIASLALPDYERKIQLAFANSTLYTAPSDGYVYLCPVLSSSNPNAYLYIFNNETDANANHIALMLVIHGQGMTVNGIEFGALFAPVQKNRLFKFGGRFSVPNPTAVYPYGLYFIPAKGAIL